MKVVHDWLQEYVGESMPSTVELERLFTFQAFEVEGIESVGHHTVLDVKVLPDRASDCLSHRGIAREIATLTRTPLAHDPLNGEVVLTPVNEKLKVTIHDTSACRRFTAALMTGVTVGESPEWLKARLHALGQRSINNVVDATNYVMLAIGQPLHAYDAQKLAHSEAGWHVGVRMACDGEQFTTLTGDTYTLTPGTALIVDASDDAPLSIAGIKGGTHAEIHAGTTSILLEAANFDPQLIRRASQSLKLQTDASKRFENDLVPDMTAYGMRAVVALIADIAGGVCEGYRDVYPRPNTSASVTLTLSSLNALLGLSLEREIVEDIFARLGFSYTPTADGWSVTPPWERTDLTIPEDIIAEVGRVYGYEHITALTPTPAPLREENVRFHYSEVVRALLREKGYSEVITTSFRKQDVICLMNALASDKGCLRSTLSENIREVLDRNMPNADLLRRSVIEVFEIGTVFTKRNDGKGVYEHTALALGVRQKQTGYTPKDDDRLRDILAVLEATLGTSLNATITRGVLECNLDAAVERLGAPTTPLPHIPRVDVIFTPFSTYPHMSRDIALWADESVSVDVIEGVLKIEGGELLLHTHLFDEFHKDGKVSYAFRLVFQSYERTLTDLEVGGIMEKITMALTNRGFTVR